MERSREDNSTRYNQENKGLVQSEETKEVLSITEMTTIRMSMEEEDLIRRMYMLVGNRWDLIAGRIPGRKPTEIQNFWMTMHENLSPKN